MKSLQIVSEYIKSIEINKKEPKAFLTSFALLHLDDLKTIKSDLEILETFNKLLGDMEIDIWKSKLHKKEIGEIKYSGTDFELDVEDREVTIEELKKLKKWIEENNNDLPTI